MDIKLLTREEVVALTDEQLKRYVDYACAEQGIPMFPAPVAPTNPYSLEKTDLAYGLPSGFVKDKEVVDAISALLAKTTVFESSYDYNGGGYNYRFLEPSREISVKAERFYLKTDLASAKDGLRKYESEKGSFEKLEQEYRKANDQRRVIVDEINEYVWGIQRESQKIIELNTRLDEYKAIAKGDEDLAKRFLIKAYPEAETLLGITITSIPVEQPKEEKEEN